jgi:DNA-binding PadR family transcriptional regulator
MAGDSKLTDYPMRGLVGLYALTLMSHGPIYGNEVAHRIAERTKGTWHLGAGALYPTLDRLVKRGWTTSKRVNGRKIYQITPSGRRFLLSIKSGMYHHWQKYVFLWQLIFDLVEPKTRSDLVVQRFRTIMSLVDDILEQRECNMTRREREDLANRMTKELEGAMDMVRRHISMEAVK